MYLVQTSADISDIKGTKDSVLSLRLPLPQQTADQPEVKLTEQDPKPLLDNYDNTSVFQITMDKTGKNSYAANEKYRPAITPGGVFVSCILLCKCDYCACLSFQCVDSLGKGSDDGFLIRVSLYEFHSCLNFRKHASRCELTV